MALAIGGSDSGGGAGIQADLKTFAALGVHGATAITAITAQNTLGVFAIKVTSTNLLRHQIDVVAEDMRVCATKTGMLPTLACIRTVANRVQVHELHPLVVDPVMIASSGRMLMDQKAVEALKTLLLPLADLVTPNLAEAEVLSGLRIGTLEDMERAARVIHSRGPRAVLVKGGHLPGVESTDVLFDGQQFHTLSAPRQQTKHTHGTGCVMASAVAAGLALGLELIPAVDLGKQLVTAAITAGRPLGAGPGAINPIAFTWTNPPH